MDDKEMLNDLRDWQAKSQKMFDKFSNFAEDAKKDMTPEQRQIIDDKLNGADISELKKKMTDIENQINEQMSKMNL